jgi:hypothetical protein
LEAEVVANAIADVTGVVIRYGEQAGAESDAETLVDAMLLTNNRLEAPTLDILGRCDRTEACESPGPGSGSVARVLHFLNGGLLNERLASSDGSLEKWLASEDDDARLIDLMYRKTMSRPVTETELDFWTGQLNQAQGQSGRWDDPRWRREFFADALWGLLTSETFLTNH